MILTHHDSKLLDEIAGGIFIALIIATPLIFRFNDSFSIQAHTPKYQFVTLCIIFIAIINLDKVIKVMREFRSLLLVFLCVMIHQTLMRESGFNFIGPDGHEGGLVTYAICFITFVTVLTLRPRLAYINTFSLMVILATIPIFLQQFGVNPFYQIYGNLGAVGTLGNRGWLIPLALGALPFALKPISKLQGVISLFAVVFSLCVSLNKTVFLVGVVMMFIFAIKIFFTQRSASKWFLVAFIYASAFPIYYSVAQYYSNNKIDFTESSEYTGASRIIIYQLSIDVIQKAPIFGSGFGSFYSHWYDWGNPKLVQRFACHELIWDCSNFKIQQYGKVFVNTKKLEIYSLDIWHPHNELLHILIAGGLLYLVLIIFLIKVYWQKLLVIFSTPTLSITLIIAAAYFSTWTFQISTSVLMVIALTLATSITSQRSPILDMGRERERYYDVGT